MPITPAFTKLQRSIVTSSIWLETMPTRLVWITLLALCDRDGITRCSQRGLAHAARVSDDECLKAIETLEAPDPDSRDMGDGRRVERVQGGFLILNYMEKMREGMAEEQKAKWAADKREQRAREKADAAGSQSVRPEHVEPNGKKPKKPPTNKRQFGEPGLRVRGPFPEE